MANPLVQTSHSEPLHGLLFVASTTKSNISSENGDTAFSADSLHRANGGSISSHLRAVSSESSHSSDSSRGLPSNLSTHRFPPVFPTKLKDTFAHHLFQYQIRDALPIQPPPPPSPLETCTNSDADSTSVSGVEQTDTDGGATDGGANGGDVKYRRDDVDQADRNQDPKRDLTRTLWVRLQDQRAMSRDLRARLLAKRARLRELRNQNSDRDNGFMRLVRPYFLEGGPLPSSRGLRSRFKQMQSIRSKYHVVEAEVEELEAQLDKEESAREILESQFYSHLNVEYDSENGGHQGPLPPEPDTKEDVPRSRASLRGITAERPTDVHPLYTLLLHAVGDRELAREHITELTIHRDSTLRKLDLSVKRERVRATEGTPGLPAAISDEEELGPWQALIKEPHRLDDINRQYKSNIDDEDFNFLKSFPEERRIAEQQLEEAETKVAQLKQRCFQKGVMRKNAPYHEEYTIFSEPGAPPPPGPISIGQEQSPSREDGLANPHFPVLLSDPSHVLEPEPLTAKGALRKATRMANSEPSKAQLVAAAMKEYGISTLLAESEAENKSDFINRWLLQRLRNSPIEVLILYNCFSAVLKVRNVRRWQEDVLYFWSRDEANRPSWELHGPITAQDSLQIVDTVSWEHVNSVLDVTSHPQSDQGDSPNHPPPHPTPPRTVQSAY